MAKEFIYSENTLCIMHRGNYNVFNILSCAIVKASFIKELGRSPLFYISPNPNYFARKGEVRIGCSSIEDSYLIIEEDPMFMASEVGLLTKYWNDFGIYVCDGSQSLADRVYNDFIKVVDNERTIGTDIYEMFDIYNITWDESNLVFEEGGMKQVFRQKRFNLLSGIDVGESLLMRVVARVRNNAELVSVFSKSYLEAMDNCMFQLKYPKSDKCDYIIYVEDKPFHISTINNNEMVEKYLETDVRVFVQTSYKEGLVVGYYAEIIARGDGFNFGYMSKSKVELTSTIKPNSITCSTLETIIDCIRDAWKNYLESKEHNDRQNKKHETLNEFLGKVKMFFQGNNNKETIVIAK